MRQRPAAVQAMSARVFVSVTVLLEFEWVLRGFYGMNVLDVSRVLRALLGIEHVTVEDRDAVHTALDRLDAGFDFADALHLARCRQASALVTFDRRLHRRAAGSEPVVELLR